MFGLIGEKKAVKASEAKPLKTTTKVLATSPKRTTTDEKKKPALTVAKRVPRTAGGAAAASELTVGGVTDVPVEDLSVSVGDRLTMAYATNRFRKEVPRFDIGAVAFSFMSKELVRSMSVVECRSTAFSGLYSVNSPLMGTVDRAHACATCGLVDIECPGHLGRIELAVPLPHPLVKELIVHLLQCICANCARLLLPPCRRSDPSLLRLKGISRIREIAKIVSTSTITCPHNLELAENKRVCMDSKMKEDFEIGQDEFCPSLNPKYILSKDPEDWNIYATKKKTSSTSGGAKESNVVTRVSIEQIRCLFDAITEEDLRILGFSGDSHPRNFILSVIPVIPERNRPPVEREGEKKHDHITVAYCTIIRENLRLADLIRRKKAGEEVENLISSATQSLFFYISHLMTNSDGKYKIRRDESAYTVAARLSGKEGFCRATAQGKRVNNCGRTIIGPGVLPFGSVIIPGVMRVITVPERANIFNIDRLRRQAREGTIIHITRGCGPREGIRMRLPKLIADAQTRGEPFPEINVGDLIERLGSAGDEVIINRQPTLHRHSLIGCRTIYRQGQKTIKIHMSYTTPANADFDGDEMNLTFPQTNRARAEVRHLLSAHKQIITSANSRPSMGLVYNCPTSAYLLCVDSDESAKKFGTPQPIISQLELDEIYATLLLDDTRLKTLPQRLRTAGIPERTPRAIFSAVFPVDFFYRRRYTIEKVVKKPPSAIAEGGEDDEEEQEIEEKFDLLIRNGVLIRGTLMKKDVADGIVHAIHNRYGADVAGRFISEAQFVLDWYLEYRGFSIGLADCLLSNPEKAKQAVENKIAQARNEVHAINVKGNPGEKLTENEKNFREKEVLSILGSVLDVGKKLGMGEIAGAGNALGVMVNSGAKGGPMNIAQIAGAVGEQFVSGGRPKLSVFGERALAFFEANDPSIEARGFVTHSFSEGLSPSEFFFHMGSSRIGLLDTAMRTAEIGAINHRSQKVLENDRIDYFGAVINSVYVYTSLSYGEGYSPDELILVKGFKSTGEKYMPFDLGALVDELNEED